jgi:predicted DNA-binding transcriptional regulator AlpA
MRLLSREDLKKEKGIDYSASQLWRLIRVGKFPRQVKIGDKNLWPEHEIDRFIKNLIAKRDENAQQKERTA